MVKEFYEKHKVEIVISSLVGAGCIGCWLLGMKFGECNAKIRNLYWETIIDTVMDTNHAAVLTHESGRKLIIITEDLLKNDLLKNEYLLKAFAN